MLGKDLLSLAELSDQEINRVLCIAEIVKNELEQKTHRKLLKDRVLAMIFEKPSTRTRVSFEVAMYHLGGHSISLSKKETQLSRGEIIGDTGKVLSRYVNIIVARVYDHNDLINLANASTVPVINGLSNSYHPCQILGDLLTLKEEKGDLEGLKLAYVGDGNNVANSLLLGCSTMGIDISLATPKEYRPMQNSVEIAKRKASKHRSKIELLEDPNEAVKGADAIYTDTFVSAGMEDQRKTRLRIFMPKFQVNKELVEKAKTDAIVLHCLPAYREEEITGNIIDGPQSAVWKQAENRLHIQKAILILSLLDEQSLPWPLKI
jgi:ornithine carbamoyltransferase